MIQCLLQHVLQNAAIVAFFCFVVVKDLYTWAKVYDVLLTAFNLGNLAIPNILLRFHECLLNLLLWLGWLRIMSDNIHRLWEV